MKAIRVHQYGGTQELKYEETAKPEPMQGEARVKIEASGINYIDVYKRVGLYKSKLPFVAGDEAAGVVDAVGPGVTEVKPGDRVAYAMQTGTYAEYACVPAQRLAPLPNEVSAQQGAAAFLQGLTAHYLACTTYPIQPGDTVLVHAAAGGLGLLLVQVAKLRGARVIGTVSTEEKVKAAKEAGADHVINYAVQDFEAEVKRITDSQGLPVVYDSVGKTTFDKSLNVLRRRGMMVLCGQSSGPVPPFDPQILNAKGSLFLTRPTLGHYIAERAELLQRAADLFSWIAAGSVKVRIDKSFPLAQSAEAQEYLESRKVIGKLLLIP
ncbi:MAG: quinone oxidoreductase [Chloroflexi bacterium]|nr:quinone oxidoreductase [Chloroflexota bacterium]